MRSAQPANSQRTDISSRQSWDRFAGTQEELATQLFNLRPGMPFGARASLYDDSAMGILGLSPQGAGLYSTVEALSDNILPKLTAAAREEVLANKNGVLVEDLCLTPFTAEMVEDVFGNSELEPCQVCHGDEFC